MSRVAELDPVIHQATRLRIMTALHRNREVGWTSLRDGLGLTDGNLGSHSEKLAQAGYLENRRALTARGFEVRLRITVEGGRAFRAYVAALQELLSMELDEGAAGRSMASTSSAAPSSTD